MILPQEIIDDLIQFIWEFWQFQIFDSPLSHRKRKKEKKEKTSNDYIAGNGSF